MSRKRTALLAAGLVVAGLAVAGLALAVAGRSSGDEDPAAAPVAEQAAAPVCPKSSRASWQKLANEIKAPVYCPSWFPQPLGGKFSGRFFNGRSVDPDRSYLVSWAWFETSGGFIQEVHVNLRAYPGKTAIPKCEDLIEVSGTTVKKQIPCFSDAQEHQRRFGAKKVTVYTANQGADSWHILYAWRDRGSLYTLSEHVAAPYSYQQVVANLDKMMRRLVVLEPKNA